MHWKSAGIDDTISMQSPEAKFSGKSQAEEDTDE